MEPNGDEKIAVLLQRIINILAEHDRQEWSIYLTKTLRDYENLSTRKQAVNNIMSAMLGGSGSLSDVVLHKNSKPLIKENDELYNLLNELYDECKKA